MNNEVKYIIKACGFICVIVVCVFIYQKYLKNIFSNTVSRQTKVEETISSIDSVYNYGETLFKTNCTSCHSINRTEQYGFSEISERVLDKKLLIAFIRNSDSVIRSGNPYFKAEYEVFNKSAMFAFPNLSDEDTNAILLYMKLHKYHASSLRNG